MINIKHNDEKKKRILKKFINAAIKLIDEEGIDSVTIRKVADIAGYNSATIYNYFDNCNQLIFLAATNFIGDYTREMPDYIKKGDNVLERFLLMWECFCVHSFKKPKIYYAIFADYLGEKPENIIEKYYQIFPEELGNPPKKLLPMLTESNLTKRSALAIKPCIEKGYFDSDAKEDINEAIILIYQGMLSMIINNRVDYNPEEATRRVMKHIKKIVCHSIQK